MADNAGPLLLRAGLITGAQLSASLQILPSGSILVEQLIASGVLDEASLCRFFHERLLVATVGLPELQRLTGDLIGLVSADMAVEFRVVPVAVDHERKLLLAMSDPSHTHAVDEVAFHTGMTVQRAVAPPSAIAWALRNFYGVDTPLAGDLGMVAPGIRRRLPRAEVVDFVYDQDTPLPAPVPFDETGTRVPLVDPAMIGFDRARSPSEPPVVSEAADRAFAEALAALPQASDSDAVARVLLAFLRRLCRRAAFFVMRRGEVAGWLGNGIGIHLDSLRAASIGLGEPSTFRDVAVTRLSYRGPVRDAASRDFLIDALGWAPAEMLAMPIIMGSHVIGILYGDENIHPIPAEHLTLLSRAAQTALERSLRDR